jgi:hypothetical protein
MSQLISEILEKDATGDIDHIYSEVRRLWGVPNVTTIIRQSGGDGMRQLCTLPSPQPSPAGGRGSCHYLSRLRERKGPAKREGEGRL